jgi:hypothetical protein
VSGANRSPYTRSGRGSEPCRGQPQRGRLRKPSTRADAARNLDAVLRTGTRHAGRRSRNERRRHRAAAGVNRRGVPAVPQQGRPASRSVPGQARRHREHPDAEEVDRSAGRRRLSPFVEGAIDVARRYRRRSILGSGSIRTSARTACQRRRAATQVNGWTTADGVRCSSRRQVIGSMLVPSTVLSCCGL